MTTPPPSRPDHAGPNAGGHPDAVRADDLAPIERRTFKESEIAAFQALAVENGYLITRDAIVHGASWTGDMSQEVKKRLLEVLPLCRAEELISRMCQEAGFSKFLTMGSLHHLQKSLSEFLSRQVGYLRPADIRTEVLATWVQTFQSSGSSSHRVVGATMMDEASRASNSPAGTDDAGGHPDAVQVPNQIKDLDRKIQSELEQLRRQFVAVPQVANKLPPCCPRSSHPEEKCPR